MPRFVTLTLVSLATVSAFTGASAWAGQDESGGDTDDVAAPLIRRLTDGLTALGYRDQARTVKDAIAPIPQRRGDFLMRHEGDTTARRLAASTVEEVAGGFKARLEFTQDMWGLGGHLGWKDTRPNTWRVTTRIDLEHDAASGVWQLRLETHNPYFSIDRAVQLTAGPEELHLKDRRDRSANQLGHREVDSDREATVLRRVVDGDKVTVDGLRATWNARTMTDSLNRNRVLSSKVRGKLERIRPTRVR